MAGFQRFHIVIQHGHVGLSIDGWVWWAERAGGAAYGGYDVVPMTRDEHEAWGLEADEVGAKCTVYRLVQRQRIPIASDIGRAGGARDKSQPVARVNKAEMAIKRAVARTFRKAYPLGIDVATVISEHELLDPRGDFVTVEGQGREIDAPARVLPGIASAPPETESAEAGADTPAAAAPEPQELPDNTPPEAPAATEPPTIKPRIAEKQTLADVQKNRQLQGAIVAALKEVGVTTVKDFQYGMHLGKDAVYQLAADGYGVEQIVEIVTGKALPHDPLGWGEGVSDAEKQ